MLSYNFDNIKSKLNMLNQFRKVILQFPNVQENIFGIRRINCSLFLSYFIIY